MPRLERDGAEVPINRRKMLALLAYLATTAQPHSREALATLFWPEYDSSSALANLRRDLSRLKEILGDQILQIEREKVRIIPGAELELDVNGFLEQIQKAKDHRHTASESGLCPECAQALEGAVQLYTGGFMAGFNLPDCAEFDEWQFFQAEQLRQNAIDALRRLALWKAETRSYAAGIEYARRWVALDSLHEPAHRLLMQLYAWSGQRSAALRQYQALVRLLADQLTVDPEPETAGLFESIRTRRFPQPEDQARPVNPGHPEVKRPSELSESVFSRETLPPEAWREQNEARSTTAAPPAEERFVIENLVSTGGFGEIYRGFDRTTGQEVAIKRLKAELVARQPDVVQRFLREVEALSRLSHPNIVRMLASFERESQLYLVMEYVPGGTLRDLLDQEKHLPVARVLDLALELADAISRAHHLHIFHRDLKPENILLDAQGKPRLIDFGLALLESQDSRLTQAGALFGSPLYMSPETLRGQPPDLRADIWAFGVILFEMLAGRPPFEADQIAVALAKILNEPVPDILHIRPGVPPALAKLLGQILQKEPAKRIVSMRQVAASLESIQTGLGREDAATFPERPEIDSPEELAVDLPSDLAADQPMVDFSLGGFEKEETPPLPVLLTSFVGREKELEELQAMLGRPDAHLVTLIGAGGIGKTRLAIEAAIRMEATFPNGVFFVPLAPVSDPLHIVPAIARVLHQRFSPGAEPKEQLLGWLSKQRILLVLDNFEHLMESAAFVSEILDAAPGVHLLVTSRERLNLSEEWVYEVPGLPFPSPRETASIDAHSYDAVRLFVQRARRVAPAFELNPDNLIDVIQICQVVEGMPLALELAAPWVRSMTCGEIVKEIRRGLDILTTSLRNLPERHRSLRAVFDQSWQRLLPAEQSVLASMSVFCGGCTREAVEQVTGAKPGLVASLVDKALLRHRSGRFEMHELIRQFAGQRLAENSQLHEDITDRHQRYYLHWLQQYATWLKGDRQREALSIITVEIDNVREAWRRASARHDVGSIDRAAESFWLYNEFRGTLAEGEAAFRLTADALLSTGSQHGLTGFLLTAQGSLAARQWRLAEGRQLMERGIAIQRQMVPPNARKEAFSLTWLAFVMVLQGRYAEAARVANETLGYFPKTGDSWSRAGALRLLGAAALYNGQYETARRYLEQCLVACQEIGEMRIRTYALANKGLVHIWLGEYDQARDSFDESIQVSNSCNDHLSLADVLCDHGRLFVFTGEYERAAETARKCLEVYQEVGRKNVGLAQIVLGFAYRGMGQEEQSRQAFQEGLEWAQKVNHLPDVASALEGLGCLADDRGDTMRALQYFQEALEIWTRFNHEPQMGFVLSRIGWATAESRNLDAVRDAVQQSLRLALKNNIPFVALKSLTAMARLLERQGKPQDAVMLLQWIGEHPAATFETKQRAKRFLDDLLARHPDFVTLSPRAGDWRTVVEQINEKGFSSLLGENPS